MVPMWLGNGVMAVRLSIVLDNTGHPSCGGRHMQIQYILDPGTSYTDIQ